MANRKKKNQGFTLIELVVGMLISGLILLAVATLSYALGQGQDVTDQMMKHQSMIRSASVRIPELIRNSLYLWMDNHGELVIWTEDANGNRQVETDELSYLKCNYEQGQIELTTTANLNTTVSAAEILDGTAKLAMDADSGRQVVALVSDCDSMQILMQNHNYVIVQFSLTEESGSRQYQVCARTRADASPWMAGGVLAGSDDD